MLSWTDKYELLAPFQFLACRILYWMRCSHLCPRSWLAILFRNYQTNSLHGGWPRGALNNWARFWGLQVPRSSINQLPWLGCRHILSIVGRSGSSASCILLLHGGAHCSLRGSAKFWDATFTRARFGIAMRGPSSMVHVYNPGSDVTFGNRIS